MSEAPRSPAGDGAGHLVLRNTAFLAAARVLTTPLSLLINVTAARRLGPQDFGWIYLATTFLSLAFLLVEWGQSATLSGQIARERSRAGEWLAGSLALRAILLPPVALGLFAACALLGYGRSFRVVLALAMLTEIFTSISNACQDAFRGCERGDLGARTLVGWQTLTALVVVPTLLLGGGLDGYLLAQALCAGLGASVLLGCLRPLGLAAWRVRSETLRTLFKAGTPFLVFNVILALQTNLDALFLSKLAAPDVVGWSAVARKLTGLLIFPASALVSSLYPTLSRLRTQQPEAFGPTVRSALRATLLAAVPLALGCALYPQIGVSVFGSGDYGPACDNLRILAPYLLLVYVSMPLGTTLVASGRQHAWSGVQVMCVVVSAVLDPLLIPWFQQHHGNGGLGVCVATVFSETLMVACALCLLPTGVLGQPLGRTLGAVTLAGLAMAAVAALTTWLSPWLGAALAMLTYGACLWALGELAPRQLLALRQRRQAPAP